MVDSPVPVPALKPGSHIVDYWFSRGWITASAYRGAGRLVTGRVLQKNMDELNDLLESLDNLP